MNRQKTNLPPDEAIFLQRPSCGKTVLILIHQFITKAASDDPEVGEGPDIGPQALDILGGEARPRDYQFTHAVFTLGDVLEVAVDSTAGFLQLFLEALLLKWIGRQHVVLVLFCAGRRFRVWFTVAAVSRGRSSGFLKFEAMLINVCIFNQHAY